MRAIKERNVFCIKNETVPLQSQPCQIVLLSCQCVCEPMFQQKKSIFENSDFIRQREIYGPKLSIETAGVAWQWTQCFFPLRYFDSSCTFSPAIPSGGMTGGVESTSENNLCILSVRHHFEISNLYPLL